MRSAIAVAAVLLLTATCADASPARWSLERASLTVDAKGAVTDTPERSSALLLGTALSYSLAYSLSAVATVERDFAGKLTIGRAGLRFPIARLSDGDGRIAAGIGVVAYGDDGASGILEETSWDASVHGSWKVSEATDGSTTFWGIASASYDPENTRTTYRLGMRYQAIGGKP